MYDGTEETFDSLLFYLLRVTLGRQGDVFDICTFLAFSFPLFSRKNTSIMLHRHRYKNLHLQRKWTKVEEKRKKIFPKEKRPVSFCGTVGRPCRTLVLWWRDQILDGEILGVKGILRHPAKKRPASLGGMERPYRTMVLWWPHQVLLKPGTSKINKS